jgi:hypothetical protein
LFKPVAITTNLYDSPTKPPHLLRIDYVWGMQVSKGLVENITRGYYIVVILFLFSSVIWGTLSNSHTAPMWFGLSFIAAAISLSLLLVQGVLWFFNVRKELQLVCMKYHAVFVGLFLTMSILIFWDQY